MVVNEQEEERNEKQHINTLLLIVVFIVTTVIAAFADIPVLRQILGFIFLTFLPGWLIVHILKINNLSPSVKLVLSVGLSVAFVMFFGLLINTLYPLLGYSRPLDTLSVVSSFSVALLFMAAIASLRSGSEFSLNLESVKLTTKEKAYLLLPAFFPFMSILGMHVMNATDNNAMLMVLLFMIPAYVVFLAIRRNDVPEKIYPPIILCIAVALVLLLGLRSNHIVGADIHTEYYLFQQTFHNGRWQTILNSTLDTCLSISLLPAIYQSFLNMNPEYLFKILYPLLFSISPLIVYILSRKYISSFYSFLASFFFISQYRFLYVGYGPRTALAILFFALSVMVLFHNKLGTLQKNILFTIFGAGCIASHYSTAWISFFVLLFTWLGSIIVYGIVRRRGRKNTNKSGLGNSHVVISGRLVLVFFAMLFLWHTQVAGGVVFKTVTRFIQNSIKSFYDFLALAKVAPGVEIALGVGIAEREIPVVIEFIFSWLTIACIALGVLTTLIVKIHFRASSANEIKGANSIAFLRKFDAEYLIAALVCSAILAAGMVMPYVFQGYDMQRTYIQMVVILAPFFVAGGLILVPFARKRWGYVAILVVLIPCFMCNTGTMYQIFGVPQAITLNSEGQQYNVMFVHDQETSAAKWFSENTAEGARIYADWYGGSRLVSQGKIRSSVYPGAFIEEGKPLGDGYIYLRYCGVVDGKLMDRNYEWHDIAEFREEFARRNLIYTNGGSEIWK